MNSTVGVRENGGVAGKPVLLFSRPRLQLGTAYFVEATQGTDNRMSLCSNVNSWVHTWIASGSSSSTRRMRGWIRTADTLNT